MGDKKKTFLTEGVLAVLIPAVAYLFYIRFESAYLQVFGVSSEFIEIDLKNILYIIGVILSAIWFLIIVTSIILPLFIRAKGAYGELIRRSVFYCLIFSPVLFIYSSHPYELLPYIFILAILIIFEVIYPLIAQRNKSTYEEKLEEQQKIDENKFNLIEKMFNLTNPLNLSIYIFLFVGWQVSGATGRIDGLDKQEYFVYQSQKEYLAIRIYKEKIILSEFSRFDTSISNNILILNYNNFDSIKLNKEIFSNLKIMNKSKSQNNNEGSLSQKNTDIIEDKLDSVSVDLNLSDTNNIKVSE